MVFTFANVLWLVKWAAILGGGWFLLVFLGKAVGINIPRLIVNAVKGVGTFISLMFAAIFWGLVLRFISTETDIDIPGLITIGAVIAAAFILYKIYEEAQKKRAEITKRREETQRAYDNWAAEVYRLKSQKEAIRDNKNLVEAMEKQIAAGLKRIEFLEGLLSAGNHAHEQDNHPEPFRQSERDTASKLYEEG